MFRLSRRMLAVAATVLLVASGTAHAADDQPQSHLYTPTNGGQVEVGDTVLVSGGAYYGSTPYPLTEYQVSVDGGQTWNYGYETVTVPLGGESGILQALWAYEFTPEEPGAYTIVSRANTDTVFGEISAPRTLYVGVPAPALPRCEYSCGFYTEAPLAEAHEGMQVELGLRFRVDQPGHITRVNTWSNGTNRVRVWRGDGTLLADQAVRGEYVDDFPTPIPVVPGVEYVASYSTRTDRYYITEHTFPATTVRSPFILPAHAGVYGDLGGFPTRTWNDSHYWVTPEFQSL